MNDIHISHLYKSYPGKPVLADFSAIIPKGKTTCLMGRSGIGKTTLLRILMGLEAPDSGEILGLFKASPETFTAEGSSLLRQRHRTKVCFTHSRVPIFRQHSFCSARVAAHRLPEGLLSHGKAACFHALKQQCPSYEIKKARQQRLRMSAVFQEDRLCNSLNPVGNILLGNPALSAAEIQAEMEAVGLTGCFRQPVRELSGGMRRRTAILRALLADYEILFLDEPFRGLDADTRLLVMDYTRNRCRDRTVLFVTHDSFEAEKMEAEQLLLLE